MNNKFASTKYPNEDIFDNILAKLLLTVKFNCCFEYYLELMLNLWKLFHNDYFFNWFVLVGVENSGY
jgi:hypothetical protein